MSGARRYWRQRALILAGACLLAPWLLGAPVFAATGGSASTENDAAVVLRIVLLRHGVRSPTAAPEQLAVYASQPWPNWPVAPGQLTEHGAAAMQSLGKAYRQRWLSDADAADCTTDSATRLIADSTPRNQDSAVALARGLRPDCPARFLGLPAAQSNPLFHYAAKGGGDEDAAVAEVGALPPALAELQQTLLGCAGDACLAQARAAGKQLLLPAVTAAERAKALKRAGTLSENLMLEYAQGLPLSTVGWGRLDAAAIARLIELHNRQFALGKRSLPSAAQQGSNLVAHLLASLRQAAGQAVGNTAPLAPADTRLLLLLGHDSNLAYLGGLLGVDWHDATAPDDYPPGGALVFELRRQAQRYEVRLSSLMPTLAGLRGAQLESATNLRQHLLRQPLCGGMVDCPLARFETTLARRLDPAYIEPAMPALGWRDGVTDRLPVDATAH